MPTENPHPGAVPQLPGNRAMCACRQLRCAASALPLALLLLLASELRPASGQIFGPTDSAPAAPAPAPSLPPSANIGDVWWAQATGWFCNPVAVTSSGAAQPVRAAPCAAGAEAPRLGEAPREVPCGVVLRRCTDLTAC